MLFSKIAQRQASIRAISTVVPSTVVSKIPFNQNQQHLTSTNNNNAPTRQIRSLTQNTTNSKISVDPKLKRAAYQDELNLFKDKINSYVQMNRIRSSNLLMDLDQSMKIYMKLRNVNPFYPSDIARLLQTLHTSIRITRKQKNKKKAEHKDFSQETAAIKNHILTIAQDLGNGVVVCAPWGLIHLFTSFATMDIPEEGIDLWKQLSDPSTSQCASSVWMPHVVGAVIDLMTAANAPFDSIISIYEQSKHSGGESPNLEQAIVGAFIKNGKTVDALNHFTKVLTTYPDEQYALGRIHDRFVGDCDDVETALKFFYDGMEGKTSYKASTHPSTVVRLMERIWTSDTENKLDLVENVWRTYIAHIPKTMGEWMFSITVNTFLQCFMHTYPTPTPEAVVRLKDVIQFYIKARVDISPIFLNTLLSNVQPWGDAEIITTIINAFDVYNLPQDTVSCRIILNSYENISVNEQHVLNRWALLREAKQQSGNHNSSPIEALDILALLRACYPVSREEIFANIFSECLMRGEISDMALIGANKAIAVNDHFAPKQAFWDNLLNQNYIEIKDDKVHHNSTFHVPDSILDDISPSSHI